MKLSSFLLNIGKPVAFYPALRKITGSTTATVFLCQFIYWTGKEANGDGWIYKTSEKIEEETGLSYNEQKTARAKLVEAGLLEERYARLEHQIYFKVNLDAVNDKWGMTENNVPECDNPSFGNKTSPDSLSTSENTSENKITEKPKKVLGIEGAILQGRPVSEEDLLPETKPLIAVIEQLASGFRYNFPKYGENKNLDRVARLIAKDGRSVEEFVAWAKANKRDPYWYHSRPDTLWGDWPQAFAAKEAEPSYYKRPAVLDEDESNYVIPK